MEASGLPWEAVFFDWFGGEASAPRALAGPRAQAYAGEAFEAWRARMAGRDPVRPGRLDHTYFTRRDPVAMTIDMVEDVWAPIAEADDWSAFGDALAGIRLAREGYDLGRGRLGFLP